MRWPLLSIALGVACLLNVPVSAEDLPARQTVKTELKAQPEMILNAGPNGKAERAKIDSVVATTPAAVAKAIEHWTGIADRGKAIVVKFFPPAARHTVLSAGDGHGQRRFIKIAGKTVADEDTVVRYQEALAASDEKSFDVWGVFEFDNRVSKRKCYVVCHIQGEKPVPKDADDGIIQPTGTATWIGPLANASSALFAEPK